MEDVEKGRSVAKIPATETLRIVSGKASLDHEIRSRSLAFPWPFTELPSVQLGVVSYDGLKSEILTGDGISLGIDWHISHVGLHIHTRQELTVPFRIVISYLVIGY